MKHGCTADPTMPGTVDESTGSVITATAPPVDSDRRPRWTWGSGNGGGALAVVLDADGRCFGWLADEGTGSDYGPRIACFKWWLDRGPSGEDSDYDRARAALSKAADEHIARRIVSGIKTGSEARR